MIYGEGFLFDRLIEYSFNSEVVVISDNLNSQSNFKDFSIEKSKLLNILKNII
jgi:hypothetical protein